MRQTATFPARDIQLFKEQLITWAGNFFSCVCFDSNGYTQFQQRYKLLAAAGEMEMVQGDGEIFPALKTMYDSSPDWIFGFFSYDLKSETEPKIFSSPV